MGEHVQKASAAPVRWGVLSTANIGARAVIPAIQAASNGQLLAIASRDRARAEAFAARLRPGTRAHGSYEALLADPDIEAIYIPLPNSQHAEWSIRAAQAGKHVLCEKPLAATAAEARRIADACRASGVLLLEAFMYRFHPQTRWVQEQVAAGLIGPVRLVRSNFAFDIRTRPGDIRLLATLGGGSLMDVGCYPLNYSRMIFGGLPRQATAHVVTPADSEVEQTVAAVLDYGDDRLAIIDCSFQQPPHQRAEVIGETGRIVVEAPFTPFRNDAIVRVVREDETVEHRIPAVDQYQRQVEHFGACIRAGTPLAISPADAVENAAAIEMIYRAAGYTWPR